jgi:hypothetical protein
LLPGFFIQMGVCALPGLNHPLLGYTPCFKSPAQTLASDPCFTTTIQTSVSDVVDMATRFEAMVCHGDMKHGSETEVKYRGLKQGLIRALSSGAMATFSTSMYHNLCMPLAMLNRFVGDFAFDGGSMEG